MVDRVIVPHSTDIVSLQTSASQLAMNAMAQNTQRTYRSAWNSWVEWCKLHDFNPICGNTTALGLYATESVQRGLTVATLLVHVAAIRQAHHLADVPLDIKSPHFSRVMQGIKRTYGTRPQRQVTPAIPDVLRKLLGALDAEDKNPNILARDKCMVMLGFGAALRRSELVSLTIGDVTVIPNKGLQVLIRQSKTDQEGRGQYVAIHANSADPTFCPLVAFQDWLRIRKTGWDWTGPDHHKLPLFCGLGKGSSQDRLNCKFMNPEVVVRLMKHLALLAGLDPDMFSGHSLRRGLLTAAGDMQLPLNDVMRQSRHKSVDTALRYMETGDIWRNNITSRVFE